MRLTQARCSIRKKLIFDRFFTSLELGSLMKTMIWHELSINEKCSQRKKKTRKIEERMRRSDRIESISWMMRLWDLTHWSILRKRDLRMTILLTSKSKRIWLTRANSQRLRLIWILLDLEFKNWRDLRRCVFHS